MVQLINPDGTSESACKHSAHWEVECGIQNNGVYSHMRWKTLLNAALQIPSESSTGTWIAYYHENEIGYRVVTYSAT